VLLAGLQHGDADGDGGTEAGEEFEHKADNSRGYRSFIILHRVDVSAGCKILWGRRDGPGTARLSLGGWGLGEEVAIADAYEVEEGV
jgi:hypothetical protein